MRQIVVVAVVLLLGAVGPQTGVEASEESLWFIGILVLVAFLFGQLLDGFNFPSIVGWFLAGIIVGETGLQLVEPDNSVVLNLIRDAALAWLVFHVSLNFYPVSWLNKKNSVAIFFSTIIIFSLVSLTIWYVVGISWQGALLIATISAFWGPFSGFPTARRLFVIQIGGVGTLFSMLIFTLTIFYLSSIEWLVYEAELYIARIIISVFLGFSGGYLVCRFKLWPQRLKGLLSGMIGFCLLTAAVFQMLDLFVLPFVASASFLISRDRRWKRRFNSIFHRVGIFPHVLYFGLIGSFINLRNITEPIFEVITAFVITVVIVVIAKTICFSIIARDELSPDINKLNLDFLSRGVLIFELWMPTGFSLFDLVANEYAKFVMQFLTLDIFFSLVFYAFFPRAVQFLIQNKWFRAK